MAQIDAAVLGLVYHTIIGILVMYGWMTYPEGQHVFLNYTLTCIYH
jgi:hypothetical protein